MSSIGAVVDGKYRVDRLIGEGGFGSVFAGHDVKLDRPVAIKMLKPTMTGSRELQKFLVEARNMAGLNHPNVVQVYALVEFEDRHYIVMEFVEGQTLADVIRTGGLSVRERLAAMRQVAAGLAALHAIGILHRDVSPNNIMVDGRGVAKLLDLGLSKNISTDATISITDSVSVIQGTLCYLSPEQVDGKGAGMRSEVFSFGTILYELLCGETPFRAEHYISVLYYIAHRDPEPIESRMTNCPPALADLVRSCMAKRPEDRPADMAEVVRRLDAILERLGRDAAVPEPESPLARREAASANPYLSRVMIKKRENFFGRRQEVQRIFARLNASPPGSISIVGDRKIGKSSLLNHVYMPQQRQQYLEQPDRMVMVFLDLQVEKDMSIESFVKTLLGIAGYELRGRVDITDCALTLDGIKTMVERLDGAGFRLTVLLDEFDAVTTNGNFSLEFFSFLRYLANHYNVAYLTSSARNLQDLCHTKEISDSPFFNIFSTMRLSTFRREEAEELVTVPSARVGRPLAAHVEPLLDMSGLFPFFIQMACCHTLEYLDENPGREPDFAEIRRRFYEEAKLHYRYMWDGFDEHERSALLRVAGGKSIPDALRHVVEELESRRYVDMAGASHLFSSTFQQFVTSEGRGKPSRSLVSRIFGRRGA